MCVCVCVCVRERERERERERKRKKERMTAKKAVKYFGSRGEQSTNVVF